MIERKLKRLTAVPSTPDRIGAYRFLHSVNLDPANCDEHDTYRGLWDHADGAYLAYF